MNDTNATKLPLTRNDIARIARRLSMHINDFGYVCQSQGRAIPFELWAEVLADEFNVTVQSCRPLDEFDKAMFADKPWRVISEVYGPDGNPSGRWSNTRFFETKDEAVQYLAGLDDPSIPADCLHSFVDSDDGHTARCSDCDTPMDWDNSLRRLVPRQ